MWLWENESVIILCNNQRVRTMLLLKLDHGIEDDDI